jgi:CheY-like chemotaxis protein
VSVSVSVSVGACGRLDATVRAVTHERGHVVTLVVDDNDINRTVLQRQLGAVASPRYHITCACNGAEAVAAVAAAASTARTTTAGPVDLVLMDVEMPVLNGLEATAQIRAAERARRAGRPLPIVGISGNARQVACSARGDHTRACPRGY